MSTKGFCNEEDNWTDAEKASVRNADEKCVWSFGFAIGFYVAVVVMALIGALK